MNSKNRLTSSKTAHELRRNIEKLIAAGVEVDISNERYVRLSDYEDTNLSPQEIRELQMRYYAAQDALGDSKMYALAYKDKADELEDKHSEECRQIALYSNQLREALELLDDIRALGELTPEICEKAEQLWKESGMVRAGGYANDS